jgi:ribosomal-protein-alanine N-acetyltransferase
VARAKARAPQWALPADAVEVRTATEADYPAIARIQAACPEAAQWPVGDYSGYSMLLALAEGLPAGFCAWRQTAADEAELLNIGTAPEFRRRGVARALLEKLCQVAQGPVFLEVAETNEAAKSLYIKQGWVPVGSRAGYYDHGNINAVVMKNRS